MRRLQTIQDGVHYDTNNAITLAHIKVNAPEQPTYYEETLYVTETGEYFTGGAGGKLSKYAEQYGNANVAGDGIILRSKSEAIDWVYKHKSYLGDKADEILREKFCAKRPARKSELDFGM